MDTRVFVAAGCDRREQPASAPLISLTEAEAMFGLLMTTGNHPTPNQYGTGEHVGLFSDRDGTIWGLPVAIADDAELRVCASPAFHAAGITDTFPRGAVIIGTTNAPTGWRDGTGNLELIFRDARGAVRRQSVAGSYAAKDRCARRPPLPGHLNFWLTTRWSPALTTKSTTSFPSKRGISPCLSFTTSPSFLLRLSPPAFFSGAFVSH